MNKSAMTWSKADLMTEVVTRYFKNNEKPVSHWVFSSVSTYETHDTSVPPYESY